MKLCNSRLRIKISIFKNSKSLMLIFKTVPRTKLIQLMRSLLGKDEILMRKLKFFNLKLVKEKELFFSMRILRKVLVIKLKIRINNLKRLRLNTLPTKLHWQPK
jgi:hypothetical protein